MTKKPNPGHVVLPLLRQFEAKVVEAEDETIARTFGGLP